MFALIQQAFGRSPNGNANTVDDSGGDRFMPKFM